LSLFSNCKKPTPDCQVCVVIPDKEVKLRQADEVLGVADATASPGAAHAIGLERMRRAGVLVSSVKSLYYEWIRTVD